MSSQYSYMTGSQVYTLTQVLLKMQGYRGSLKISKVDLFNPRIIWKQIEISNVRTQLKDVDRNP